MKLLTLAWKSLLSRRLILSFSLLALGSSLSLLLTLNSLRFATQEGFTQTVSQVDLLVGARGGALQLLLFSVFNVGSATNNVSYESYLRWKSHPSIAWTIPYSLGDSYRGFRVVGTDQNFFQHYRYRGQQSVKIENGKWFEKTQEVVLGSKVAAELKLNLSDEIVITHGVTKGVGVIDHRDRPFRVVGVMKSTGTSLDQSVYISLESMELIHLPEGTVVTDSDLQKQIKSITSFFVRTKNRVETLRLQRDINEDKQEPLMAIVPGMALSELWRNLSYFEKALELMIGLVSLFSLLIVALLVLATLETRRREMSLFRALGAQPKTLAIILFTESTLISFAGALMGIFLHRLLLLILGPTLQSEFGMNLSLAQFQTSEIYLTLSLVGASLLATVGPILWAQKRAVKDGLAPKF